MKKETEKNYKNSGNTETINWILSGGLFPGFYGSELDPNICEPDDDDIVEYHFDFDTFKKEFAERFETIFGNVVADGTYIKSVKVKEIYSPRQYNFSNDTIEIEAVVDLDAIRDRILSDKELYSEFDAYLYYNYKHRDGFFSRIPDNAKKYFDEGNYQDVMLDFYSLRKINEEEGNESLELNTLGDFYGKMIDAAECAFENSITPL